MSGPGRGGRLGMADALSLLVEAPLAELAQGAHEARLARYPENQVTWVFDTNPNHTNVCVTACAFCAFHRPLNHPESFLLSPEALVERVERAVAAGATTVLLQGGHHPQLTFRHWQDMLRALNRAFPTLHIHPFSPPEILFMARREGVLPEHLLARLREEGIHTLPGGGAEVLVDEVRRQLAPRKCSAGEWLSLMAQAHGLGFTTTATLMYGHVESPADIVAHLLAIRDLQDKTGGFSSFIPWSFKAGETPLAARVKRRADALDYLRLLATARLVLDNVPHIQSSWFSEGLEAGQLGLLCGADDFGGLLWEESVLLSAGHAPRLGREGIEGAIAAMGFVPCQRDSSYGKIGEQTASPLRGET